MSAAVQHLRALSRVERASNRRASLPTWRLDVLALSRARAAAMDDGAADLFAVEVLRLAQLWLRPFAIAEHLHAPRSLVGRVLGRLEPPSQRSPSSSAPCARAGMVPARAFGRRAASATIPFDSSSGLAPQEHQ